MVTIRLVLVNKYGEFLGKSAQLSEQHYEDLMTMVKGFYLNGGFELTLVDDTFVVFPPEIVKQSILKIVKLDEESDV